MSNTIGYDLEGFANSSVTKITGTNVTELGGSVEFYAPFDSDLNDDAQYTLSGTASGSAAVSTSVKKFGAGSLYLPNRSDRVTYDDSGNSISFSGDYTIEAWVYFTDVSQPNNYIWSKRTNTSTHANNAWVIKWMGPSDNAWEIFQAQGSSQHVTFHSDTISTNTWYHLAVVRSGTNLLLFRDGTLISGTNTTGAGGTLNNPTSTPIVLGEISGGTGTGFAGYIDDFRIIDGVALYTSNFVAPTSALTSTAEVTSATVETKFLSSVWNSDDVSEKMADGTWIRNDVTSGANPAGVVVQGAGLEVAGHRYFQGGNVRINAIGAGGHLGSATGGGLEHDEMFGGFTSMEINIAPGTPLNVIVGGGGEYNDNSGPFGGGGAVGSPGGEAGSGGGYSGVFEGPVSQANAIAIAGGGGGGKGGNPPGAYVEGSDGAGGGLEGNSGGGNSPIPDYGRSYHGTGGTQSAGGVAAGPLHPSSPPSHQGSAGSALQGGDGAPGGEGGGGGGGYYGGGGGWRDSTFAGGGGGGSGNAFTNFAVSGQSTVQADSSTDTLTLVGSGLNTITTDASTDTLTIGTPTGIAFVKEDGTSTSLQMSVAAGTLSSAVSSLYIPFTKEDGSSVTTLVMS